MVIAAGSDFPSCSARRWNSYMTPLVNWVEGGAAPQRIPASLMEDSKTVRTRPLCPYPEVARYTGSGSVDDAANFSCSSP